MRTPVGDKYILDAMLVSGAGVGGEKSGHVIIREHTNSGDGIVTALEVLSIMARSGRRLSELAADVPLYPAAAAGHHASVTRTSGRRTGGWSKPCVPPSQSWRGVGASWCVRRAPNRCCVSWSRERTRLACSRWPTALSALAADRLNQPS